VADPDITGEPITVIKHSNTRTLERDHLESLHGHTQQYGPRSTRQEVRGDNRPVG
jgi:hypothetical protein